jgi:uncharacterized membrane protein YbhN (UPF0104 family)
MVWVEARAFGVPLLTIGVAIAIFVAAMPSHHNDVGTVIAAVILIPLMVGFIAWVCAMRLDGDREARYAPIFFRRLFRVMQWVCLAAVAIASLRHVWLAAMTQHSAHDATSLIVGVIALVVLAVLMRRNFGRTRTTI